MLTSEDIFEQTDLPPRMAVIGLGAIGLELGQAIARLGVTVSGFDQTDTIGGLQDPAVRDIAIALQRQEWDLHLGAEAHVRDTAEGLEITSGDERVVVDKILVAIGSRPNVQDLGFETLGIELDKRGLPAIDPHTAQIGDLPVYLVGDANGFRPILHEALDEGFIAGRHGVRSDHVCRCRRTPLRMV